MKETIQDKKYWGSSHGLRNPMGPPGKLCRSSQEWGEQERKHGGGFEGSRHLVYGKERPVGFDPLSSGSEEDEEDDEEGGGKWDLPSMSSWGVAGGTSDPSRSKPSRGKVARSGGRAWPFEVGTGSNPRGRSQLLGHPRRRCFRRRRQRTLQAFRMLLYSKSSSLAFHWKLWGKMASKGRRRGGPKRARSSLSLSPGSQPDDDHLPLYKKNCLLGMEGCPAGGAKRRPGPSEPHLDYELDGAFPASTASPQASRLSLLGALIDETSPYPQYVELQGVTFDKDPGAMEMDEEAATMLKYTAGGAQASPRTRRLREAEHGLEEDGGKLRVTIALESVAVREIIYRTLSAV